MRKRDGIGVSLDVSQAPPLARASHKFPRGAPSFARSVVQLQDRQMSRRSSTASYRCQAFVGDVTDYRF